MELPRFTLRGGIFLVFMAIVMYACKKELQTATSSSDSSLTISEAKKFFEADILTQKKFSSQRHGLSRRFFPKQNKWQDAFVKKLSIGDVVVAPLQFSSELYLYRDRGRIHLSLSEVSYMLCYRDSAHKMHAEVITYLPDNAYFRDTTAHKKFSGVVTITDWYGNFLKGFLYDSSGIRSITGQTEVHINKTIQRAPGSTIMLEAPEGPQPCIVTDWYTCGYSEGQYYDCHYDYTEYDCSGGDYGSGGGGGGNTGGSPSGGDYGDLPPKPIGGGNGSSGGSNDPPATFKPLPEDVQDYIYNQPFALFHDVPCDSIKQWLAVTGYQPGSSIIDKLNGIVATQTAPSGVGGPGFTYEEVARVQNINDAFSSVVNMDYFSVKVNSLPVISGVRVTPDQFLQYIRKNINSFVNTDFSKFTPYKYGNTDDTNLWNADNPFGAVVSIEIPGTGVLHNDGSVITSYYSSNKWTFTTIHDPMNGEHPVSGNRNFGYTINTDGTYTFYTQGVDRLTDAVTNFAQLQNLFPDKKPFTVADALWESFQGKIFDFIRDHSGVSIIQPPLTYRPNWQDVKDVLDGKKSLSTLSKLCPD